MESGKLIASSRDVYYVSSAKEKSRQHAHRIEERVQSTKKVMSQDEHNEALWRARRSL